MNQTTTIILLAIAGIFLVHSVGHAEGTDCYECYHADIEKVSSDDIEEALKGIGIEMDGSCKTGKKPKDKYSKACPATTTNVTTPCFKLTVDDEIQGTKVKITLRGCFPTENTTLVSDDCSTKTAPQLSSVFPKNNTMLSASQRAISVLLAFGGGKGNTCFCEGNECNSAFAVNPFHASLVVGIAVVSYLASF